MFLQVHTYEVHRSFCVTLTYGRGHAHAYIISHHVRQAAVHQYCMLFFCVYKLWTSHTKDVHQGLQDMQGPPTFMDSWTGGDSDAVVPITRAFHAYRHKDIWRSLRIPLATVDLNHASQLLLVVVVGTASFLMPCNCFCVFFVCLLCLPYL